MVFHDNDPIEKVLSFIRGELDEDITDGIPGENSPYQGMNPYNQFIEEVIRLRRENAILQNQAAHFQDLVFTITNAAQACGTCSPIIQDIFREFV